MDIKQLIVHDEYLHALCFDGSLWFLSEGINGNKWYPIDAEKAEDDAPEFTPVSHEDSIVDDNGEIGSYDQNGLTFTRVDPFEVDPLAFTPPGLSNTLPVVDESMVTFKPLSDYMSSHITVEEIGSCDGNLDEGIVLMDKPGSNLGKTLEQVIQETQDGLEAALEEEAPEYELETKYDDIPCGDLPGPGVDKLKRDQERMERLQQFILAEYTRGE